MVKHAFNVLGERDVTVTGKDASGATSYHESRDPGGDRSKTSPTRMQLDPKAIEDYRAKSPRPHRHAVDGERHDLRITNAGGASAGESGKSIVNASSDATVVNVSPLATGGAP